MQVFITVLILAALALLPFLAVALVARLYGWDKAKQIFPLKDKAPREAGKTMLEQFQSAQCKLVAHVAMLPFFILLVLSVSIFPYTSLFNAMSIEWHSYYGLIFFVVFLLFALKTVSLWRKVRCIKTQWQAEVLTGQELSLLFKKGFDVYHDIVINERRIHHLLISVSGVYVVTTLSHARPSSAQNIRVTYKDENLIYPNGEDKTSVNQTRKLLEAVNIWLKRVAKQRVEAKAVIISPGWLVEQKGRPAIPVLSFKQIASYFAKADNAVLTELEIDKINACVPRK